MPENNQVLIFTGGHHSSGLPVAKRLSQSGWKIIWIGHRYSMWGDKSESAEYQEVIQAGFEFIELKAGKFHHTFHPAKLLRLPLGFIRAFFILNTLRQTYHKRIGGIVSFGGYLSVPVVFSGWLFGMPVVTHEQTIAGGLANRVIYPMCKKVALTWPVEKTDSNISSKYVLTGLPLRPEILGVQRKKIPGVPPVIYVTGGKQGSHLLNSVIFNSIQFLVKEFEIIHQTGSSSLHGDYQKAVQVRAALTPDLKKRYQIYSYLDPDQVARTFSRADVVVSRSGAHIVYELAYLGIPCVLVPIPWSSNNEQNINAQFLASHKQAIVLNQTELTPQNLYNGICRSLQLQPEEVDITDRGLENLVSLIEKTFSS